MNKKIDILHIRDAVSKTIVVENGKITLETDTSDKVYEIPAKHLELVTWFFDFAYNRADEFNEDENGVELNISGGEYTELGDRVHDLYQEIKQSQKGGE